MSDLFSDQPHIELMSPDWPGRCVFGRGDPKPSSLLRTDFPDTLTAVKRLHEAVLRFRRGPTEARAQRAESHSLVAEQAAHTLPIDDQGALWLLEQFRPWWAQRGDTMKLPKGFDRSELCRLMTMSAFAPIKTGVQVIVLADRQRRAELSGEALEPAVGFQWLKSYVDLLKLRKAFPSGFVAYPDFTRIKHLIGRWWARWKSEFGTELDGADLPQHGPPEERPPTDQGGTSMTIKVDEATRTILSANKRFRFGGSELWDPFHALWKAKGGTIDLQALAGRKGTEVAADLRKHLKKIGLEKLAAAIKCQQSVGHYLDLPAAGIP